jgi:hypothetical protein
MSEEHKELVRRFYAEAMNAGEIDKFDDFFTPELAPRMKASCGAYLGSFPDLHASIDDMVAEGDTVFLRGTTTGTHDGAPITGIEPTGRRIAIEFAESYKVRDGRFVGYWCQADMAGLVRQLTEEKEPAPVG